MWGIERVRIKEHASHRQAKSGRVSGTGKDEENFTISCSHDYYHGPIFIIRTLLWLLVYNFCSKGLSFFRASILSIFPLAYFPSLLIRHIVKWSEIIEFSWAVQFCFHQCWITKERETNSIRNCLLKMKHLIVKWIFLTENLRKNFPFNCCKLSESRE